MFGRIIHMVVHILGPQFFRVRVKWMQIQVPHKAGQGIDSLYRRAAKRMNDATVTLFRISG